MGKNYVLSLDAEDDFVINKDGLSVECKYHKKKIWAKQSNI